MTAPALRAASSPFALAPDAGARIKIRRHARPDRWTASVLLPQAESISLHRVDDPLGEARAQLATCGARNPRIIAVVGAGLGYLTEAAHERFPDARIIVLEPLQLLAENARARTPALYESSLVRMVVGPAFDAEGDLWRLFDVEDPDEPDPALLLNPALQRAIPAAVTTAVLMVRRATRGARMNARARRDNAGRYVVNTLRNLPHIIKGVDPQRLVGQFAGVPAVLVAAGPSLDQNLPVLRTLADRALIVATDTSWRPLVSAGIDPHLVVSLDPSTLNGQHLTGVTSRRDTWVFAEGSVEPDALKAFAGRVGTFRVGMHHPWPWLTQLGVNRPLAHVWGSVLTAAFDLSLAFGCDPLVFVGADLAFTDKRPYCRGTTFERTWARYAAEGVSLRKVWHNSIAARASMFESDVHGKPVLTAANLVEFRNWLVNHAGKHAGRRVINATGAGILFGPGIEQVDLATTLASYPDRGDTVRDTVRRLLSLRTVSVHLRPVMDALAVVEEAAATCPEDSLVSPVSEWVTFGRPSLTSEDIRAAAMDGRAALERPSPSADTTAHLQEQPSRLPTLRLHAGDRVARMRALLTGDRTLLDGCAWPETLTTFRERQAVASDLASTLDALLAMPRLVDDVGDAVANRAPETTVPLSYRYAWTTSAAPLVAALEELQLEGATPLAATHEGGADDFWSGWIVPVVNEVARPADLSVCDDERRARLELTSSRLVLLSDEYHDASQREQRLAKALIRATSDPALSLPQDSPYRLELLSKNGSVALPVSIDALMRALTGTLAWANGRPQSISRSLERMWPNVRSVVTRDDHDADPRLTFLARDVAYLEPLVLTTRDLARGYSLYAAASEHVVFVPSGSTQSVLIAPDGTVTPGSTWPVAITGEVPWGTEGGALAWSSPESQILLRRRAGETPVIDTVPFKPIRMALAPDGSAFWSAAGGAVWTWLPGQSGQLVTSVPTWGGIFVDGNDLVLPPVSRNEDGRVIRQRLGYEWRYAPDAPTLRRVEGATEGQCFGAASLGDWTARAYPYSDLVHLERRDGDVLVLACHTPTSVAWAGDSLVVGTSEGAVLVFRALLDRLNLLCPRTSPRPD